MRKLSSLLLAVALFVTLIPSGVSAQLAPGGTFVDDNGNVHEPNIEGIAAAGITRGCNPPVNDEYCPAGSVTRAEVAAFLIRAMDREGEIGAYVGSFPDVPAGAWYAGVVELAAGIGITTGYTDGTFRPNDVVSRAEMSALVLRAIGVRAPTSTETGTFSDVPTNAWFVPWVEQMYEQGITTGCDTDPLRFCPSDGVRRDEMATFLTRAFGIQPIVPPAAVPSSGFPDASNTGVPAGVSLRSSGSMTVSNAGAVIDGYDISGSLNINASNVTVRNTRVRSTDWAVIRVADGVSGVVIEDCEVVGGGMSGVEGQFGIVGTATVRGCDISAVTDGVVPFSGSLVEGNYIHGLLSPGSPHYDGIQIDGGISDVVIRGNTIVNTHDQTSAVMIDNWFGPIRNIRVEGNRLLGGGFTVYSDGQFDGGSISGVSFINNRLGRGYWGYASIVNNTVTSSGNVDDGTGQPVNLTR